MYQKKSCLGFFGHIRFSLIARGKDFLVSADCVLASPKSLRKYSEDTIYRQATIGGLVRSPSVPRFAGPKLGIRPGQTPLQLKPSFRRFLRDHNGWTEDIPGPNGKKKRPPCLLWAEWPFLFAGQTIHYPPSSCERANKGVGLIQDRHGTDRGPCALADLQGQGDEDESLSH